MPRVVRVLDADPVAGLAKMSEESADDALEAITEFRATVERLRELYAAVVATEADIGTEPDDAQPGPGREISDPPPPPVVDHLPPREL